MDRTEWEHRFKALGNIEELLSVAAPNYQDPQEYFNKLILEEKNEKVAEKRLKVLENLRVTNEKDRIRLELERTRRERDKKLKETDWTQLADVPVSSEEKKFYRKYREYLRELPKLIESGKLECDCMEYREWKVWIEKIRHTPGFTMFVP